MLPPRPRARAAGNELLMQFDQYVGQDQEEFVKFMEAQIDHGLWDLPDAS